MVENHCVYWDSNNWFFKIFRLQMTENITTLKTNKQKLVSLYPFHIITGAEVRGYWHQFILKPGDPFTELLNCSCMQSRFWSLCLPEWEIHRQDADDKVGWTFSALSSCFQENLIFLNISYFCFVLPGRESHYHYFVQRLSKDVFDFSGFCNGKFVRNSGFVI